MTCFSESVFKKEDTSVDIEVSFTRKSRGH